MTHDELLFAALASVPTTVSVLIGILLNNSRLGDMNGRIGDLNARMASMEGRMGGMENRLANLDHKLDTRFDLLLGKVVEIENRLTRIEAQRR